MKRITALMAGLVNTLIFSMVAQAHNLDTLLLKITMSSEIAASVSWKTTDKQLTGMGIDPMPVFPDDCKNVSGRNMSVQDKVVTYQWQMVCTQPLLNRTVTFTYLDHPVMVAFTDTDGRQESRLLDAGENAFLVPAPVSLRAKMLEYFISGIEHLLLGWDHLLFVISLFYLLHKNTRTLILTITSFTVAHSCSLIMASLGYFSFNAKMIEVFIAITLIILALEILNMQRKILPLSISNRPYLLTFAFGLVHGCGFASVLAEALSAEGQLIVPLLSFNVGIEAGQLIIIAACMLLFRLLLLAGLRWQEKTASLTIGSLVGSLSVYWLVERLLA